MRNDEKDTSWENVSDWYQDLVTDDKSYQNTLILPNTLRLLDPKKGENIVDLACGPGLFSYAISKLGANVLGIDASTSLIKIAKENAPKNTTLEFLVSKASKLTTIESGSTNKVLCVLALQNIKELLKTFNEVSRILKPNGTFFFVLNHPNFRIPKSSSWDFDEKADVQYRRVDTYMSEKEIEITMNPGRRDSEKTFSYHRPLQSYFKSLKKSGFAVTNLEEWISNKTSTGTRAKAENTARKEFPLFMAIVAKKSP